MRITEGQLRRVVRGIIREDLRSFIKAATDADLNYAAAPGDPLMLHPRNKEAKRQSRVLKNLWRQHSNQESFRRLTFVHWFSNAAESVPEFVQSSGKDEISTSISSPDDPIGFTRWGVVGIQLKGWVTFAGNNMNQMMSGYMDKVKAKACSLSPRGVATAFSATANLRTSDASLALAKALCEAAGPLVMKFDARQIVVSFDALPTWSS